MDNEIKHVLVGLRESKEMSQDNMAELLHCTRQNISNYERGRPVPSWALQKYSEIFNFPLEELQALNVPRAIREENEKTRYNSGSLEHAAILPSMLHGMSTYASLFPYKVTWEYLIAKKLMGAGYVVSAEPSVKAFQDQYCIDYQLRCLAEEGISEAAISELIMWFKQGEEVPSSLFDASPTIIEEYSNLALRAIKNKELHEDFRAKENASGDYLDHRFDRTITIDILDCFARGALRLDYDGWFPVDYRLDLEAEGWSKKQRENNIKKADACIKRENLLIPLEDHGCYGIHEYGSVYRDIFDSLFDTKEDCPEIGLVFRLAKVSDGAKKYVEWYENWQAALLGKAVVEDQGDEDEQ